MAEGAAIAALVVSVFSANEQRQAAAESAKRQKEANKVKTATQKAADIAAMRQKAREERVRRARIQQAAENMGTGSSSGEAGAIGSIQTNLATAQSFQSGQAFASGVISNKMNKAAEAEQRGANWQAVGQIANTVFGATSGSLFDTTPAAPKQTNIQHQPLPKSVSNTNPYTNASIFDVTT